MKEELKMKGLIYKDFLVTKKYYITTFIILIILHLFIQEKWTAILMPLLLLIFQNSCMKSIFSSDNNGKFSEFVDGAVGMNHRVKGVYLYTILNVVICGLITLGYFIHSSIDISLALKFNCIQLLIYLLIWSVQLPISLHLGIAATRISEFAILAFACVIAFGLTNDILSNFITTVVKTEPQMWASNLSENFSIVIILIFLIIAVIIYTFSFLLSLKMCDVRCDK